jgi:epoxyqueuosine reductase
METKLPTPDGAAVDGTVLDGAALVSDSGGANSASHAVGVGGVDLADAEPGLVAWLEAGFHGDMDYMVRHGMKRARAAELVPGTACA